MTDAILILPDMDGGEALLARRSRNGTIETTRGDVDTLSPFLSSPSAIILPGQSLRGFLTDAPEKLKSAERLSVARFAHEDALATAPDDLHIVMGSVDPAPTLMLDRAVMESVLSRFDPAVILADFDALATLAGEDLLLLDRVVSPGPQGAAMDPDWVDDPATVLDDDTLVRAMFERIDSGAALNLRSGAYRRRTTVQAGPWARIAALALICGLIGFGLSLADLRAKSAQANALQVQARTLYQQSTGQPAPADLTQLARQAGTEASNPMAFLALSDRLFATLAAHPDIRIERMSYEARENSLRLRLIYPGFDAASALESTATASGAVFTPGGVREQNGQFIGDAALSLEGAS